MIQDELHLKTQKLGPTLAYMMPQYSPEWWSVRRGIPSASQFKRILTPTGKLSASADTYINELIADRVCLDPNFMTERPMTREMANGLDVEPQARDCYKFLHDNVTVIEVGGCITEDGAFWSSPDGLVDEDGCLELKCPTIATHIGYLREGILPSDYIPQVHGHLAVTGRAYCDFMSYAPFKPKPAFVVRVTPNDYTAKLKIALMSFNELYQKAVREIFGENKEKAA